MNLTEWQETSKHGDMSDCNEKEDKWKQEEANKQETMNRNIEMFRIKKQKTYKTPQTQNPGSTLRGGRHEQKATLWSSARPLS